MKNQKLLTFVQAMSRLLHSDPPEPQILSQGAELLARLLAQDDWLPVQFAQPHPEFYRQYLLYADPLERFSVVSFVWGPGQKTPVHDHLTWGLIGMLRGQEIDTQYFKQADGSYQRGVSLTLVHGAFDDEDEYVFAPAQALDGLLASPGPLTFFGHTHYQGGFSYRDSQIETGQSAGACDIRL